MKKLSLAVFLAAALASASAAVVHGTVTDPLGQPIRGASVALLAKGKIVAQSSTQPDGSYQITTAATGRFYVLASASSFKQIATEGFFAGAVDGREEDVVLEPDSVRQEVVDSATGVPTSQAQLSSSIAVQRNSEFQNRITLADSLRQVSGNFVVQTGQYGGRVSLLVRGGKSDSNKINFEGGAIEDIGGVFDFGDLDTLGVSKFDVYRGPDSVLYGSDAASSVVSLDSQQGTTSSPSFFFDGDIGNFTTFRQQIEIGGAHRRIDYYGGFSAFQSSNSLPADEYHDYTGAGSIGLALSANTTVRASARNSVSAVGTPGAYDFYGIPNEGKLSNQDTYLSGSIENRSAMGWHNLVRYAMTRKRQEDVNFFAAGIPIVKPSQTPGAAPSYYGYATTIAGANGTSVRGQAVLNFPGVFPNTTELVSNRDQLYFQSDYAFTSYLTALAAFRFEDERGAQKTPAYGVDRTLERANYDYTLQFQGGIDKRVYYVVGGGVEKNQLFGTVGTPQIGVVYYPMRPGAGLFRGMKIVLNFSQGYQEPSLQAQFGSLYRFFLTQPGGGQAINQFHIQPIGAEDSRVYQAGGEENFLSERGLFRAVYFHNQYRNQIESVSPTEAPALLPGLTSAEQQGLRDLLTGSGGLDLNSQSFRSQGVETEIDFSLMHDIFLRGGYTYLDSVVQRSFTSDALSPVFNTGPPGGPVPFFADVPIGNSGPLRGARPFRRPPHTGFTTVAYTGAQYTMQFTGAYASRSDDSTFLGGRDFYGGNSLLLPNRNLDRGYAKLDLGASYQMFHSLGLYAQFNNLLSDHKIGPIGYPSLPFTFRIGLRINLGH